MITATPTQRATATPTPTDMVLRRERM
jgi:hypothetical protein